MLLYLLFNIYYIIDCSLYDILGAGGRDSPSVRPPNADGWTNVSSSKARGFAPTPVDASKFKLNKVN